MNRRRIDPITEQTIKASVREAFEAEQRERDAEFEAQMKRLLEQMDEFTKGEGDGSADPAS